MVLTWNGFRLFRKFQTAASYALKEGKNPRELKLLERGKLVPATWEIQDLIMHMRDQCVEENHWIMS